MSDDRDDVTTRAASYAAGALSAAERREVESEMRRDRRLAAEVREFTETAALLGLSPEPVAPDSSLRGSILAALDDVPQHSPVVRGPWFARPVAVLVGAAAAALLVIGGTFAVLTFTPREPSPIDQIIAAADYERVVHEMEDGASVTAVWSDSLGRAALLIDDMAAAPSGHTYQAWFIDSDGHASPDATFDSTGTAVVSVALVGQMHDGDAIGITIEPLGGSEAPTTDPLLVIATA